MSTTTVGINEAGEAVPEFSENDLFVFVIRDLAAKIHDTAVEKGFYTEGQQRNVGEMIALCHSELSEALEYLRKGNAPDDHLPNFDGATVELADTVIRILDLAHYLNLDLAEAILAKMEYNRERPFKHGKNF